MPRKISLLLLTVTGPLAVAQDVTYKPTNSQLQALAAAQKLDIAHLVTAEWRLTESEKMYFEENFARHYARALSGGKETDDADQLKNLILKSRPAVTEFELTKIRSTGPETWMPLQSARAEHNPRFAGLSVADAERMMGLDQYLCTLLVYAK